MIQTISNNLLQIQLIQQACPTVSTLESTYSNDQALMQTICNELNIQPTDFLLTLEEVHQYNAFIFETNISKITIMDFSNTTLEDELCKLNSQY